MSDNEDWLKNLKAGDKVFVGDYLETVERITPTGRIRVDGSYYNQRGVACGKYDAWHPNNSLREATPERIEKYRRDTMIKRAYIMMGDAARKLNLTYEQAVGIVNILKSGGEQGGN